MAPLLQHRQASIRPPGKPFRSDSLADIRIAETDVPRKIDEETCLHSLVGVVDGNALMPPGEFPLSESFEGEHGLVHPEELEVLVPDGFN